MLNLFGVIGVAYFDVQQFVDNPPLERNVIYQYGCAVVQKPILYQTLSDIYFLGLEMFTLGS